MTATIRYDRPVKNLIDALSATGHVTHRSYKKTSVTFHHNAGRLSHEGVLNVWKRRPASAHFDVDGKGAVAQYVKTSEYAWSTGNTRGNQTSISIEMANSSTGGNWPVAVATWKNAARLAGWLFANVIKERPSKANVHYHSYWASTQCAGPYMDSVYDLLLADVVRWYNYFKNGAVKPRPQPPVIPSKPKPEPRPHPPVIPPKPKPPAATRKSNATIAGEVWAGKWGRGEDRVRRLKEAGYDPVAIQKLVNQGVGRRRVVEDSTRKSNGQIAEEVIAGKWGNGRDRVLRLTRAGYDPDAVQREVNKRV